MGRHRQLATMHWMPTASSRRAVAALMSGAGAGCTRAASVSTCARVSM
jgi:hypothetical protein